MRTWIAAFAVVCTVAGFAHAEVTLASESGHIPHPFQSEGMGHPASLSRPTVDHTSRDEALAKVRQAEQQRIDLIARVSPATVCVTTSDKSSGGSGVIISPDGYGLTNFHVVMGLGKSRTGIAGLADGTSCPLEVLGVDPTGDLAMFRLTGRDHFDFATLGDSDAIHVGDEVIALGNPFMLAEDYHPTATFGIISGLHRYQFGADARSLVYTDCIQIDASINPGNSGGPLFDMAGRLIGINGRASFKHDLLKSRINVGVAYAITINQIKRFIPAMKQGWLVEHGTLGATVTDTDDGPVFDRVLQPSAASRAGIRIGDRLVALDGRPITSANALLNVLGVYPAGWPVEITVHRDGLDRRRQVILDPLTLPTNDDLPMPKADPQWIRAAAAKGSAPILPKPKMGTDPVGTDPFRGVVRIYGGRIADQRGYASGVLVSADGEVITALAMLLEGDDLRVVTCDGVLHRADVKYRDERRQLALLKIRNLTRNSQQTDPLPPKPLTLDESVTPAAGDSVFVVGNPFKIAEGDEPCSVTRGIFSGRINLDARKPGGEQHCAYHDQVLLLDAMSSNPGSPGSAVFDADGRWVGLVGEIVESRQTNTLLNYAYPLQEVAAFLREAHGETSASPGTTPAAAKGPGYHGIRLSRIGFRSRLPFVDAVARNSPAAQAGLKSGDLIVSANNEAISKPEEFSEVCRRLHPGDELVLVVKRGAHISTLTMKLTEAPQ